MMNEEGIKRLIQRANKNKNEAKRRGFDQAHLRWFWIEKYLKRILEG